MAYTETIIVEPNTEIDTIQKALDAITTSNPVIYIKDGEYKFKDNGDIDIFVNNNTGIRISPNSKSIEVYGSFKINGKEIGDI